MKLSRFVAGLVVLLASFAPAQAPKKVFVPGQSFSNPEDCKIVDGARGPCYSLTLKDDLISWWKLNETSGTRADSVGSNTLTDYNTVLAGGGVNSWAIDLNTTGALWTSGDPINESTFTGFTVQFWVKYRNNGYGPCHWENQAAFGDRRWFTTHGGFTVSPNGVDQLLTAWPGTAFWDSWSLLTATWDGANIYTIS